jgi:hypothetical protein
MMAKKKHPTRYAGAVGDTEFGVATVAIKRGERHLHPKAPCAQCPWRADLAPGAFPAEAFRISANTAEDMSPTTFACHMAGLDQPQTCAGFLLRGGDHNLAVRLASARQQIDWKGLTDGGFPLHDGYVSMAVANGVSADDPALARCRLSDREVAAQDGEDAE